MIDVNETVKHFGGTLALRMIGGRVLYDTKSVSVKFKAQAKSGIKGFKISLKNDLYEIEFYKIRGLKITLVASVGGIYAENLRSVIESNTGLYLKF